MKERALLFLASVATSVKKSVPDILVRQAPSVLKVVRSPAKAIPVQVPEERRYDFGLICGGLLLNFPLLMKG